MATNPQNVGQCPTAQNGQQPFDRRSNADKANAVKDLLRSNPDLSNREIGRRIGVSPQTVSNWRDRLAQADMFSEGGAE
ncbi:helix-turn-helix domain-containing protein [Rhizobium sp. PP-CC-3G-465]|uniref:helix-turn-helix domain-containing protein n=1 Tax=Rhizobium sp. PP-CC-3G-465 TaxID=2135648 RepID=UPI00104EA3ED|nr:Homeodomain-like domain-containing protein [Rhizobium sp. PP-CC-3G-465]